ncbi:hypothetical protein HAX54_021311 [Datura stramonium]|uniref:Pectate lyase n=1 Tax=Datura stramonium TaxID=4076 RepID=A0ABS8UUH7_DATST|nr:hypothetical protein [Datura stramonium]
MSMSMVAARLPAARAGGGAAKSGGSGGGSKVVHDGSKNVTIVIDGISGKANTSTIHHISLQEKQGQIHEIRGIRPENSTPVFVNVYGGGAATRAGRCGGAKDVSTTIVVDGISGKVNTTTIDNNSKCDICRKAIFLESVSVNGGIRANGGDGGCGDGVESGAAGGPNHAK